MVNSLLNLAHILFFKEVADGFAASKLSDTRLGNMLRV